MTFQRGSSAPRTRINSSYGEDPGIEPISIKSAGVKSNAAEGYGMNPVGDIYKGIMDEMPETDKIVDATLNNRAEERMNAWRAESQMAQAGIQAAATVASAEETAKGLNAQAAAAQKGGAMSAIGGIASAAIGLISDEETKHTIDAIESACEVLRELRPVTFFYKEEYSASPERMHYGFIAQEYQKVMPDATYYDESIGKLCIDPIELISLLVRANQELETRITRLEAKQALAAV